MDKDGQHNAANAKFNNSINMHPWWNLSRLRIACLATGAASLALVAASFVFELLGEAGPFRLGVTAAALVFQVRRRAYRNE